MAAAMQRPIVGVNQALERLDADRRVGIDLVHAAGAGRPGQRARGEIPVPSAELGGVDGHGELLFAQACLAVRDRPLVDHRGQRHHQAPGDDQEQLNRQGVAGGRCETNGPCPCPAPQMAISAQVSIELLAPQGPKRRAAATRQRQRRIEQRRHGAGARLMQGKDRPADAGERREEDGRLETPAQRQPAAVANPLGRRQDDRDQRDGRQQVRARRVRQIVQ